MIPPVADFSDLDAAQRRLAEIQEERRKEDEARKAEVGVIPPERSLVPIDQAVKSLDEELKAQGVSEKKRRTLIGRLTSLGRRRAPTTKKEQKAEDEQVDEALKEAGVPDTKDHWFRRFWKRDRAAETEAPPTGVEGAKEGEGKAPTTAPPPREGAPTEPEDAEAKRKRMVEEHRAAVEAAGGEDTGVAGAPKTDKLPGEEISEEEEEADTVKIAKREEGEEEGKEAEEGAPEEKPPPAVERPPAAGVPPPGVPVMPVGVPVAPAERAGAGMQQQQQQNIIVTGDGQVVRIGPDGTREVVSEAERPPEVVETRAAAKEEKAGAGEGEGAGFGGLAFGFGFPGGLMGEIFLIALFLVVIYVALRFMGMV
jgi:hypothetical protein